MSLRSFILFVAAFALGAFCMLSWHNITRDEGSVQPLHRTPDQEDDRMFDVNFEHDLVSSSILSMLGPMRDEEDRVFDSGTSDALLLTDAECQVLRPQMRSILDNWARLVELHKLDSDTWDIRVGTLINLSEQSSRCVRSVLGSRRGYLFLVLIERDLRALFEPRDLRLHKMNDHEWELVTGQSGHIFDLTNLADNAPIKTLVKKATLK